MFNQINPYRNMYPNQPQFISRQVTNIEEAKAYLIDAFNTYLFVDTNAGKIYLKRMNNSGLSDFYTFGVVENPKPENPIEELTKRISILEDKLGAINESISNNVKPGTTYAKSDVSTDEKSKPSVISKGSGNDGRKE